MKLLEILTPQQVAQYLQVSLDTVYRLAKSGRLPGFKVGESWRFHKVDIERYITYRYYPAGAFGEKSTFYREAVLDRYRNIPKKYYIRDEAFSGVLGNSELYYYQWKQGKISGKKEFVEVKYRKVRWNTAKEGQPAKWEILVVLLPESETKIMSIGEEYSYWKKYALYHLSFPDKTK